jgi:hypothetical protein
MKRSAKAVEVFNHVRADRGRGRGGHGGSGARSYSASGPSAGASSGARVINKLRPELRNFLARLKWP